MPDKARLLASSASSNANVRCQHRARALGDFSEVRYRCDSNIANCRDRRNDSRDPRFDTAGPSTRLTASAGAAEHHLCNYSIGIWAREGFWAKARINNGNRLLVSARESRNRPPTESSEAIRWPPVRILRSRSAAVSPQPTQPRAARALGAAYALTANVTSTSTVEFSGSSATPTAARAWIPASPNTSPRKLLAPLATRCWSVKSLADAT